MTSDTLRTRLPYWKDLFWLGGVIASFSLFVLSIFAAGVMALWGDDLRSRAQDWLGITAIHDELVHITGGDRVIREDPGMAYVREPVRLGEPITLVLFISRTEVGAACRLDQFVPIFTDDYGVTISGQPGPPVRQIGTDSERLEVDLVPPVRLGAGKAFVRLQLEYLCGTATVFETTEPVAFTMLPRVVVER